VGQVSGDTSPEAQAVQDEGYRRMSPARKLALVWSLRRTVLALARARLLAAEGPLDEDEILERLAKLWLPEALHQQVCAERRRRRGGA
jgi:hypothetical protein